jgi:hypothetical protein
MNNNLFFLCCGVAFLVFSIIVICTAPIITGVLPNSGKWNTQNCKIISDEYDIYEKNHKNPTETEKIEIEMYKRRIHLCRRQNAMYSMEYTSVIFDVILSFICTILGLLHYFDVGKSFEKFSGLIGLISGAICFILTFIYIIYSCYIFDNDTYINNSGGRVVKLYSNGAIYKYEDSKYKTPYDEEKHTNKPYLNLNLIKYKDLGKKQYNYNSKMYKSYNDPDVNDEIRNCNYNTYTSPTVQRTYKDGSSTLCDYIWPSTYSDPGYEHKYLFDKWITSIIFGVLILVCDIGLAIFGFLLFSGGSGTKGHVPVK